ncbi:ABC transporter ATP-binding protein, partial [Helicobacter pylori]
MARKKHKISTLKYFLRSLKQIYMLITFKEKMVFFLLVLMAVFSSFVEVMSLTLLMPFITLASDPNRALDDKDWKMVYDFFHFSSPVRLMYFFSFCLVGIYLFRMFYGVSFT